jgi:hypothetical protein
MDNLKDQLIRLGSSNPELRDHLKPLIDAVTDLDRGKSAADIPDSATLKGVMEDWMNSLAETFRGPASRLDMVDDVKVESGFSTYVEMKLTPGASFQGRAVTKIAIRMKLKKGVPTLDVNLYNDGSSVHNGEEEISHMKSMKGVVDETLKELSMGIDA